MFSIHHTTSSSVIASNWATGCSVSSVPMQRASYTKNTISSSLKSSIAQIQKAQLPTVVANGRGFFVSNQPGGLAWYLSQFLSEFLIRRWPPEGHKWRDGRTKKTTPLLCSPNGVFLCPWQSGRFMVAATHLGPILKKSQPRRLMVDTLTEQRFHNT